MNPDWKARADLAVDLARRAGDLALGHFNGSFEIEYKADRSPVTVADKSAEELIRRGVAAAFPADGFVGEESGTTAGSSGYRWVVDPVDGTKAFVRGVPLWGTLVGVEYDGEPVAGAAYAPGLGQMFHAVKGGGAFRDGKPIRVSDRPALADSLMCFSGIQWFRNAGKEPQFLDLVTATAQQRGWGDFYGFVLVAQGAAELMIDYGVSPWDVAAVRPIVEEAGGTFTDWAGVRTGGSKDVIASNGKVHAAALAILGERGPSGPR